MASLIPEQWEFLQDLAQLIVHIDKVGLVASSGEAWRTPEMQQIYIRSGRSWTSTSRHLSRCAIDLNLFNKDLTLCTDRAIVDTLGAFWESLDHRNVHGLARGPDGEDTAHFERKV